MSKVFVKSGELELINGGYLVKGEIPVSNPYFEYIQQRAEYVITFAKLAKGKNFVATKVDSLPDLVKEVNEVLNKNKPIVFVSGPESVEKPLTDKLKAEALNFMNFQQESSKTDKINAFLQEFTVLKEFEEFGLFFEEGVVKLNKIYTMQEVVEAVKETIDLLG